MIGLRTSGYVLRRGAFYLAAFFDIAVRLAGGWMQWDAISFGETGGGELTTLGVQTVVSLPVVGAMVIASTAAFLVAQTTTRARVDVRAVTGTLFVASLLVYSVGPGISAFGALLCYMILTASRVEKTAGLNCCATSE